MHADCGRKSAVCLRHKEHRNDSGGVASWPSCRRGPAHRYSRAAWRKHGSARAAGGRSLFSTAPSRLARLSCRRLGARRGSDRRGSRSTVAIAEGSDRHRGLGAATGAARSRVASRDLDELRGAGSAERLDGVVLAIESPGCNWTRPSEASRCGSMLSSICGMEGDGRTAADILAEDDEGHSSLIFSTISESRAAAARLIARAIVADIARVRAFGACRPSARSRGRSRAWAPARPGELTHPATNSAFKPCGHRQRRTRPAAPGNSGRRTGV